MGRAKQRREAETRRVSQVSRSEPSNSDDLSGAGQLLVEFRQTHVPIPAGKDSETVMSFAVWLLLGAL
ncbi:unnamed protein product [Rhodiola kirilowii]